ncbi:pentapeptide repeat-containing protein [Sphaerothrix gracilis]|uniref:pentapeptide repeat-containing protein n=1 Tax=Sphaerothrix gracilis TaxID=3151835 RepID=UPI0031FD53C0
MKLPNFPLAAAFLGLTMLGAASANAIASSPNGFPVLSDEARVLVQQEQTQNISLSLKDEEEREDLNPFLSCRYRGVSDDGALQGANCKRASLQRIDLSGRQISLSFFNNATFDSVDLANARLSNIFLNNATLRNVSFNGATFTDVSFNDANLRNVDLRGITQINVNWSGARLTNVRLSSGTNLANLSGLSCENDAENAGVQICSTR